MKNRMIHKKKNGKFWCNHIWDPIGEVGPDWDIICGVKILCKCSWCKKLKYRASRLIKEIPDELINPNIGYF